MANKFSIIYVDPPWRFNARNNPRTKFGVGAHRYPTMTCKEILELPVKEIAADNAALFLWSVSTYTWAVEAIMEMWGFRFVNKAFCWVKVDKRGEPRLLPGHYTGSNTEDCWLGIRGRMPVVDKGVRQVITTTIGRHSSKPGEVRDRIVRLFGDVPRIELFARERVEGWETIGNEIDGLDINDSLARIIGGGNE